MTKIVANYWGCDTIVKLKNISKEEITAAATAKATTSQAKAFQHSVAFVLKHAKEEPTSDASGPGRIGLLADDAPDSMGSNPDALQSDDSLADTIPGGASSLGGCIATAIFKAGVYRSKKEAIKKLDAEREKLKPKFREDQQTDAYLGIEGSSWHVSAPSITSPHKPSHARLTHACLSQWDIVKNVVIEAGFDWKREKDRNNWKDLIDSGDSVILDGVCNDSFMSGNMRVEPYEKDDDDDNPHDNPRNWQHTVLVKKGMIHMEHFRLPSDCLRLNPDGVPLRGAGFFLRVDRVYCIRKKEPQKRSAPERPERPERPKRGQKK